MNDPTELLSGPAAPGLLGALVGLKFAPGDSWYERASNFACGALIATYGGPAAVEYFSIGSKGMTAFIIFVIGIFGLSLAAALFTGIKETKFSELIAGFFPGRKG